MVIYDSPDAYRMNRFAYGLNTNNGGITIESMGTFFTYERTPAESYYSLEELFRHEGVHYLQGRYEEPGLFGDSPLYDNDRLTWIDEGSAEFFAGSTRMESVKPRYIKAHLIQGYDPSTWYSVDQVVHATYASGWTFYDYASEFVDYLYHGPWDNYLALLDRLKANDPTGFSTLCTQDAGNSSMSAGYRNWLQYVAANVNSFPSPSTSPDYLASIPAKPLVQVTADIQATTGLTNVSTTTTTGLDWNTYTLRGTYAAGASQGSLLADWQAMDAQANAWLQALTAKAWSGYKTDTCYFVNYAKDASNNVTWQVVFHGVNTDNGSLPNTVTAAISSPSGNITVASGTSVAFAGSATDSSSSATLTYAWTFGDGGSASGASANHTFTNTGSSAVTYTVTFKATDNTGASGSATRQVTVNPTSTPNTVMAAITSPASNVTVASGASVAFAGSATDSNSSATLSYAWTFGDGGSASGASANHAFTNTGSSAITYTVTFKATDNTGASASATRQVTVNPASTAPSLNLQVSTGPGNATFNPNASSNVTKVTYWVDQLTPFSVTAAPFTTVFSTASMTPGSKHNVYARAYNAAGAYTDSGWVSFTVISGQLSISVSAAPATGGSVTFTPTLGGNVVKVIYYVDNWDSFTTVTASPWTGHTTGLTSGTHYVCAEAIDATGRTAYTSWVTFVIP